MSKQKTVRKPLGKRTTYRPEYCKLLVDYAKTGPCATFDSFADKLGVDPDTIHLWASKHPEFKAAKGKAKRIQMMLMMKKGEKAMFGGCKAFHQSAWIFWMKCRFGSEWKEDGVPDDDANDLEFYGDDDPEGLGADL